MSYLLLADDHVFKCRSWDGLVDLLVWARGQEYRSGGRCPVSRARGTRWPSSRLGAAARCRLGIVDLPPGPRVPAGWQTVPWTVRPAAFLWRVNNRFGDPFTIRTLWTDEPMVLFSHPDAVRDIFRLDAQVAPGGQTWEFLRQFARPHSILVLDRGWPVNSRRDSVRAAILIPQRWRRAARDAVA